MGKQRITRGAAVVDGLVNGKVEYKNLRIPLLYVGTTGYIDTGVDLPVPCIVRKAYLDVNTLEATASSKLASAGIVGGTSTAGFLNGVSTASAGPVAGAMVASGRTMGTLFIEGSAASQFFVKEAVFLAGATADIGYQLASAHTELSADLVLEIIKL